LILLVHGWGFDARLWDRVCADLGDLPVRRVELGFSGAPADSAEDLVQEDIALAVGHSLGMLWLLHHGFGARAPLLSINGFPRFTEADGFPGVPARNLAALRRRCERDPASTLQRFWQDCGGAPDIAPESAAKARLLEGLDWLRDRDERPALAATQNCAALASRDDGVVQAALSTAAFAGHDLRWAESGGHVLPLTAPALVAETIRAQYEAASA